MLHIIQVLGIWQSLRIHWRLSTIVKTKKEYEVIFFWYVKVCIFWKWIQYTIHWDKSTNVNKNSFRQNKQYIECCFFFCELQLISFTFNLWLLYELKLKVSLSKTVCGILHFLFHLIFIVVYIFAQQNAWTLWL